MIKARFNSSATSNIAIAVGMTEIGEVIAQTTTEISEGVLEERISVLFYQYGAQVEAIRSECDVWEDDLPLNPEE